jgi:O-antigen/teichoic acid export membrane protein
MLAARMQLRYVLAADVEGALPLSVAAPARLAASLLAIAALAAGAALAGSAAMAWAVVLVALVRAAEDAGDLLLGLAQRADDWAAIARSLVLRGLGGAAVFGAALAIEPRLETALPAALVWQGAITLFHDWPAVRRLAGRVAPPRLGEALRAIQAHAALGGAAALVSLNAYVPRYAVERALGLEAVGVFTALAQLALMGNLAVQAVGQAAVAPLSRAYAADDRRRFLEHTAGLVVLAAVCGVAGIGAAASFGPWALAALYRPEYAQYGSELSWLMGAAALTYVTAVLGYALMATGERRLQLRIFALSAAAALAGSLALTPSWGLRGAAAALLIAWVVAAAGAALALAVRLRSCRAPRPSPTLSGWGDTEAARPGAVR